MFLNRKEDNQYSINIAIGANLPDGMGRTPLELCESAALAVASIPGLRGAVKSRWFSSAPIPPSDQPRYINGVMRLEGDIAPETLLSALQAIERAAGRVRSTPNAARTLDLDIVNMGALVREAPDPVLPHPRAHLRAFVLLPLRDVAPDWVHPKLGVDVTTLIRRLLAEDIAPV